LYVLEVHILNNYIPITQPYGKCKGSYTSVRRTAHKILFVGRRTTDMPHVDGVDDGVGYGVLGRSPQRIGVGGESHGSGDVAAGVSGYSPRGYGVVGRSDSYIGVDGGSDGRFGNGRMGIGVRGRSRYGLGVLGESHGSLGVVGNSYRSAGVVGHSYFGEGVSGLSENHFGVFGWSPHGYAGYFEGAVYISGPLEKPGGSFKIDHPLDPANKYLCHSFVESPDMKNVYDGVVALDDKGEAVIELPDWFGALNKDLRYQLTAIRAPGPNLYIAEEISDTTTKHGSGENDSGDNNNGNRFKIAGGNSGMKVSWHVTGIRKDPWANAHRIQVEEDKPDRERGYYLYPDLYGQPAENGISRLLFPEKKQELLINQNKLT
jgi:hypothetical protein